MVILERIGFYFQTVLHLASDPVHIAILFGSVMLGIMFGASYAMMMDSHIRVDIIHARLSNKWKLRWDLFGIIFLLLPFIIIIFHQSLDFVYESWRVNEHSDAPMGLPWRWAIKGVIPASFALLFVAAISRLVRIISLLRRA